MKHRTPTQEGLWTLFARDLTEAGLPFMPLCRLQAMPIRLPQAAERALAANDDAPERPASA